MKLECLKYPELIAMKLRTILFLATSFLFLTCQQDMTGPTKNKELPISSKGNSQSNNKEAFYSIFKQKSEVTAINRIKHVFDEGLRGNSEKRDLAYLYKDHAQRMRLDYFNKYPYTLNYPYNGKFDLNHVKEDLPQLSFLTNKCGFQSKDGKKTVHYYCFKKESEFMKLMETLGKDNSLIASLHNDYAAQKHISQQTRNLLLMNSYEDLDFQKKEHQLIYMFYQILINEERLAAEKIK